MELRWYVWSISQGEDKQKVAYGNLNLVGSGKKPIKCKCYFYYSRDSINSHII